MKNFFAGFLGSIALSFTFVLQAQTLPPQWRASGSAPDKYEMTLSQNAAYQGNYGASIRLTGQVETPDDFGTLIQAATAVPWRGKRVAMRAWIRTELADSAQMWLRIDGVDRSLFMDNMDTRPIVGSHGWQQYQIVMEVPQAAYYLVYGVFLVGGGHVEIDGMEFEAVPRSVPLSPGIYKPWQLRLPRGVVYTPPSVVLDTPSNLDFEQTPP